jgi:SAM-dependent methyltransferase
MRYDWKQDISVPEATAEFYREIDRRFFDTAATFLPSRGTPFDALIDFDVLRDSTVLEIGVGLGSHAALLARHAGSFVGIDLTEYAVENTRRRFALGGLRGDIVQMDGERLAFRDASFDFIWSWGVIHHSSDTVEVLREMHRVLKPGGRATVMVYHRSPWTYYVLSGLLGGLLRGHLLRTRSLHRAVQLQTDGALARYYSMREWRSLAAPYFVVERIRICGQKTEMIPLSAGRAKDLAMRALPDPLWRFLGSACRLGGFLVATMVRR